jgi:hypothetical protein
MRAFALVLFFVAACRTQAGDAPKPDKPVEVKSNKVLLGAKITEKDVALTEVAKNPKAFHDKAFATSGTVIAVCQSMGCWMELKDDQGQAHVKLAGHSFFVPKTASGRKARVQAKVVGSEEGRGDEDCKEEAEKQMGKPVAKLELEATGVELD